MPQTLKYFLNRSKNRNSNEMPLDSSIDQSVFDLYVNIVQSRKANFRVNDKNKSVNLPREKFSSMMKKNGKSSDLRIMKGSSLTKKHFYQRRKSLVPNMWTSNRRSRAQMQRKITSKLNQTVVKSNFERINIKKEM